MDFAILHSLIPMFWLAMFDVSKSPQNDIVTTSILIVIRKTIVKTFLLHEKAQ